MKNTYRLPRAEITIVSPDESPIARVTKLVLFEQLHAYYKRMREPGLSESDKEQLKNRIQQMRAKTQRGSKENITIIVKLTEPKFRGYKLDFNFERFPDMRLSRILQGKVKETIRHYREFINAPAMATVQSFGGIHGAMFMGNQERGRVFHEPNTIFKKHVRKNMDELFKAKQPTEPVKFLGIELEFCAKTSQEELALKLFKAGLQKIVQLKDDGSLRPHEKETGFELALLLKENTYKKDLKKVIDVLSSVGAIAHNRRCGLHVHLDMRHRNKKLVFNNLVACQRVLMRLVDPSRYNNEFCQMVKFKKIPENFTGGRAERYKTINAAAYYKFKTLEVRMHEGSVDFTQICGWVDILVKIANFRKKLTKTVSSLTMLKKLLKLNEKMHSYAVDRSCYWQLNGGAVPRMNRNRPSGGMIRQLQFSDEASPISVSVPQPYPGS